MVPTAPGQSDTAVDEDGRDVAERCQPGGWPEGADDVECPSCGASDQHKARCEACGFAFPQAVAATDDALSLFLGLVCIVCDTYNDPGTEVCVSCGSPLEHHEEPELPASLSSSSDVPEAIAAPPAQVSSSTLTVLPAVVVPPGATANDTAPFAPAPGSSSSLPAPPPSSPAISASTGSGPVPVLAAPPSWMSAPTGQPLATHLAMKKVDLASISTVPAASLAAPEPHTPSAPTPSIAASTTTSPPRPVMATATVGLCFRCQAPLEPGDKFCRNCGARVDGTEKPSSTGAATAPAMAQALSLPSLGAGPAATQVISALKLPNLAPAQSVSSPTSTMVMPAMKLASSAPSPTPGPSLGVGAHLGAPTSTMVFGAATVERVAKLILVRGHSRFGSQWRLQAGETLIGRSEGLVLFPDDNALGARHARLVWRGVDLMLEPEPTTNGVYVRLRQPVRLQPGDEFLVGAQRLRVLASEERPKAVDSVDDGTSLLGSVLKPNPPITLLKVGAADAFNEVYFRPQRLLTIGRAHCDVNFDGDGFVSERHAQLTHEGTHLTLEDLGSRNGTYVRARTALKLAHGDLLLLGDQVLRIELPQR